MTKYNGYTLKSKSLLSQSPSPEVPLLKITCVFFQKFSTYINCMYF